MVTRMIEEATPETQEIIKDVHRIAEQYWLPYVRQFDFLGGAQARIQLAEPWMALWTAIRDAKLICMSVPREYGGLGVDSLTQLGLILCEATKVGQSSTFAVLMCQSEAAASCLQFASSATRDKYMRRAVAGGIQAYYLTEPQSGVDYGNIKATAVRQVDKYVINGQKWWVGHADPGPFGLNYSFILAKTDPTKRLDGLSMFIVDNTNPGILLGREGDMVGFRIYPRWEVALKDCVVPAENLIGREGQGGRILIDSMNRSYGLSAFDALGIAECALEYTADYTRKRVVFGHPICEYQGIHYPLADMDIMTSAARALAYKAARLWDTDAPDKVRYVVRAKMYAAEVAEKVTNQCMKILSAQGVERGEGHPVERLWREWFVFNLQRTTNLDRRGVAQFLLGRKLKAGFEY